MVGRLNSRVDINKKMSVEGILKNEMYYFKKLVPSNT